MSEIRPRLKGQPNQIRAKRLALALTREQLADKAGLGVSTIHKLEGGFMDSVSPKTIQAIAKVLDCDVADISEVEQEASA